MCYANDIKSAEKGLLSMPGHVLRKLAFIQKKCFSYSTVMFMSINKVNVRIFICVPLKV